MATSRSTTTGFIRCRRSRHSLRWQIRRADDGFKLFFDVKTSLFDAAAQQALVDHVLGIIDQWLDDRTIPVGSLSLLSEGDHQRLVVGFNTPSGPPVPTDSVVAQFESTVAANPDAVAVEGAGLTLTYDQLNRQANRVANHLLATGLHAGDYVGILLPRSPDVVIALLGVLKAGGAYLPMEPSTPGWPVDPDGQRHRRPPDMHRRHRSARSRTGWGSRGAV